MKVWLILKLVAQGAALIGLMFCILTMGDASGLWHIAALAVLCAFVLTL